MVEPGRIFTLSSAGALPEWLRTTREATLYLRECGVPNSELFRLVQKVPVAKRMEVCRTSSGRQEAAIKIAELALDS